MLAERLPRGPVVALDGSPAMIEQARARLARFGDAGRVRRRGPRPAAPAGRARRRDPLDRDVPLGPRPRRAVPEPGRGPPAGRPARRPVRRRRQHRVGPARARDDRRRLARRCPLRDARRDAAAGSERPASSTSSAGSQPEPTPFEPGEPFEAFLRTVVLGATSPACRRPSATRSSTRSRRACPSPDRLRPAQHPRPPRRLRRGSFRRGSGTARRGQG